MTDQSLTKPRHQTRLHRLQGALYQPRSEWLGPALMLLVITATALLGDTGRELLRFDRGAISNGQWWRLWSGQLVHAGWYHWMLNALGLAIYVRLCGEPLALRCWAARFVLLGLGVGLGIWFFAPDTRWYVGLSGAQHGFFLLGLWHYGRRGDWICLACLGYLVVKLLYEEVSGGVISDTEAIGVPVLTRSHLSGAVAAVAYWIMLHRWEHSVSSRVSISAEKQKANE